MTTLTPIITTDAPIQVVITIGEETPFTVEVQDIVSVSLSDISTQVPADWNATSGPSVINNKPTIPAAQVPSDWNSVVNPTQILNKPTIPTALSQLSDDATHRLTNDTDITKLAGIEAGAEVNVNADWNAISGDAQILNKPTIPAAQVNSDWNAVGGVAEILNKPSIVGQQDSDWNSITSPTKILNKPTIPTALADLSEDTNHRVVSDAEKSTWNGKQDALGYTPVQSNPSITGATKTKISYDAKGLVTSGTDATTADISDSSDKRYVTDAQSSLLSNFSDGVRGVILTGISFLTSSAILATDTLLVALGKLQAQITSLSSVVSGKLNANVAITPATKTKITYDANGLITSGADATQDDIGDGTTYKRFSDTEKTKLAGIEAGAEVNVNADWNAVSGDAQILNKPTIPSGQVNSDWNAVSGVAQILNKPTIPTALADLSDDATHRLVTDTEKSTWNGKQDALGYVPVESNVAIVGGTNTKITYDSKGLVTSGSAATQDDIGDGATYKQYSDTEKTKLAGIEAGAEVNVNADWNSVTGDSEILNKPTIPTALADLSSDSTHRVVTDVQITQWNGGVTLPTVIAISIALG